MNVSLRGTDYLQKNLDGIIFLSFLCIMYIKVVFISTALLVYSGIQGNAVSLLFHKRHLLSESEFAFSFIRSPVFVQCFICSSVFIILFLLQISKLYSLI